MPPHCCFGRRLLPSLVDQLAKECPHQPWMGFPINDNDIAQGYKSYTYAELANAVNFLAYKLERDLGKSTTFEPIAYIGPNDARYFVVVLATIKTGHVALLASPRNSVAAQVNLFKSTDCKVLITDDSSSDTVSALQEKHDIKILSIGTPEDLIRSPPVDEYLYTRDFEQGRFDPFVILHTSGSTGFPKPITVRAGSLAIMDAYHDLPDFQGRPNFLKYMAEEAATLFVPMPMFHIAGLSLSLCFSVYFQRQVFSPPPSKSMDAGTISKCLAAAQIDATFLPPSTLEEMSNEPTFVELFAKMKFVATGSGSVARNVGNRLVKSGVNLQNIIASTEHVPYSIYHQDPDDWSYFLINDEPSGFEWRHVEDDVYELFVVRRAEDPHLQSCFYTFPDLQEWSTRDLYKKHPSRANNWMHHGRADNIVVLSNGEKFNPVFFEDAVSGHPQVKGALVVGTNRFQPALLVEPAHHPKTAEAQKALIDDLWPYVAQVNESSARHARIQRPFLVLTPENRCMPRSGKGSIQRAKAEEEFHDVVDMVFESADEEQENDGLDCDFTSQATLMSSLRTIIARQLPGLSIEVDTDFFAAGMDSVQILTLSRLLNGHLRRSGKGQETNLTIAPRDLYANPTVAQTASHIWTQIHSASNQDRNADTDQVRIMVRKYTETLPRSVSLSPAASPATEALTVVLTGSTGSIGSYIVDILEQHPSVARVIALNRGDDSHERQQKASALRGLPSAYNKTTFWSADLSKPLLGLSSQEYEELRDQADVVLHCQWRVNFNLSLASFAPQIEGTRRLIDLSLASRKRTRIVFVTSVAEVTGYTWSRTVPEVELHDHTMPAAAGYGASKLVASRILGTAARDLSVPVAIVRVGQVGGPVDRVEGSWNRWEWFPSIVASSLELGMLPQSIGEAEQLDALLWVPVEREAQLLVDITLSHETGVFNGVNPRPGSYRDDVLPVLQKYLSQHKDMATVTWAEWVEALKKSEPNTRAKEDVDRNPGVKLVDFYFGIDCEGDGGVNGLRWDTQRSQRVSNAWRTLEPVQPAWVEKWLKQWNLARAATTEI